MNAIKVLSKIVKELKKRGILTDILQSAEIDPVIWTIVSQNHNLLGDSRED
ncbi:hypothetical protein [Enterococcus gallinarum]|uniref:hypothetical protein n=1 Tax=Enterococcus gallinarum TaxID=1353 RepID=UPI0015C53007|nr:hypothetical protein [Enterococcus gallinarum]NQE03549.1 hypothetical protein [Enterococcus gallinarum]